ncbi:heavy metal translocating P-type ATPase [Pelomonas aquatica]|uniref:P-type Zn(2+) transporter n=1 Tax=Pelomonas aquatica TaxID=431058 RepID=A0A9X4LG14_9BURK|nr:heavy metal translocating P-type ATPase [Pelomonas aquatica]MCY4755475.1 heavy metal translocating P-type ATPase [Pelomonas aquatica]MDG0862311.1 heavy metal translocating P-type ATPase [Pelomonas aquatica]
MSAHEHTHAGHRHDHHHGHGHSPEHSHDPGCCHGAEPTPPSMPAARGGLLLRIPAMDCPTEEGQIRRALEGFADVRRLHFDLPARALSVDAPAASWAAITAAIAGAGFQTETLSAPPAAADTAKAQRAELLRLLAALTVAVGAELLHFLAPDGMAWQAAGMAVAALAVALSGLAVFRKGLAALLRGQLNINALMSVAVAGAFAIGQWPEAAMVMALYSLAEFIEARSVERARHAITGLLALSPEQAEVRQPDGSWARVDAKAVAVGATARVKPGERFALDGRVTAGRSAVDQSPVTGESIPVDKATGDAVFAGTINQGGALEFEVTRPAGDTVLAGIIHAVEAAQGQRAPTQRFVDRFAAVYTPAVFVLALAVAVGTPALLGWPWLTGIYKALVLLVIACPCALVISTPVTVVSGLAAAARRGILIKGGVHLEQARKLKVLALDKTGTLTEGRPRLVAQRVLAADLAEARVLRIAHSLAARSDHPVSKAVAAGLDGEALPVDGFGAELGHGVHGRVDGLDVVLGNHRWIHDRGQCSPELEALMQAHEAQGRTVSLLADGSRVLALFAVADTTKPTSREAVAELLALGVRPVMLTGDNPSTAQAIGAQVGIADVQANLLPQDKQQAVIALGRHGAVGMVGDGVNDAPSLAAAAIGFSMGAAGTDTAKDAADVLIMNDDLRKLPETIRLSKRTYAVLWQNIVLALGIKAAFFVLAVFGSATMWMAVFADMGASLLVVFNGLRLLRSRP